jgi:hypothetical protein
MIHINQLSLTVKNPEIAARALAEMTNGTPKTFESKNMPLCIQLNMAQTLLN